MSSQSSVLSMKINQSMQHAPNMEPEIQSHPLNNLSPVEKTDTKARSAIQYVESSTK